MRDYDLMVREYEHNLFGTIMKLKLEEDPIYSEECESCGGVKDHYASRKEHVVKVHACFNCGSIEEVS